MKEKEFIEMVSKGISGLIRQGHKSVDPHTKICVYQNKEGSKCIIGHMMTPRDLSRFRDVRRGVRHIHHRDYGWEATLSESQLRTLVVLQACHDLAEAPFVESFTKEIELAAWGGSCQKFIGLKEALQQVKINEKI